MESKSNNSNAIDVSLQVVILISVTACTPVRELPDAEDRECLDAQHRMV